MKLLNIRTSANFGPTSTVECVRVAIGTVGYHSAWRHRTQLFPLNILGFLIGVDRGESTEDTPECFSHGFPSKQTILPCTPESLSAYTTPYG